MPLITYNISSAVFTAFKYQDDFPYTLYIVYHGCLSFQNGFAEQVILFSGTKTFRKISMPAVSINV